MWFLNLTKSVALSNVVLVIFFVVEGIMEEANRQRKTLQQQQYVSKSLKRAFAELEEARTTNMELPDASDLFKLIDKQWRSNKTIFINQRHAGNPPLRMKDRPLLSYQQRSPQPRPLADKVVLCCSCCRHHSPLVDIRITQFSFWFWFSFNQ